MILSCWQKCDLRNATFQIIRKIYIYFFKGIGCGYLSFLYSFFILQKYLLAFYSFIFLTGVTTAQLRRHLSNMNFISNSYPEFYQWWKIWTITERKKCLLSTPPVRPRVRSRVTQITCHESDKAFQFTGQSSVSSKGIPVFKTVLIPYYLPIVRRTNR